MLTLRFGNCRRTPVSSAAVAIILCITVTVGCSAGDEPLPPVGATTPPLDQIAYVKAANTICAASDKKISDATNKAGVVNNNGGQNVGNEQTQLVEKITPIAQNAIDQLKSLTPPAADAAKIQRGLALMQTTLNDAQKNPSGSIDPIGQADKELYTYGLASCFSKPGG